MHPIKVGADKEPLIHVAESDLVAKTTVPPITLKEIFFRAWTCAIYLILIQSPFKIICFKITVLGLILMTCGAHRTDGCPSVQPVYHFIKMHRCSDLEAYRFHVC